jgi:hypothetical protein
MRKYSGNSEASYNNSVMNEL